VPGLSILLTGTNNARQFVSRATTTDADGSYTFTGLLPGTYSVTALGANKDVGIVNIHLGVGQSLTDEDFSLHGHHGKH
jgi:protocatechuate 3,4-dioxygenase beta subunit